MSQLRKLLVLVFLCSLLIALAGCARHESDEKYFLVATNLQIPYWQTAKPEPVAEPE